MHLAGAINQTPKLMSLPPTHHEEFNATYLYFVYLYFLHGIIEKNLSHFKKVQNCHQKPHDNRKFHKFIHIQEITLNSSLAEQSDFLLLFQTLLLLIICIVDLFLVFGINETCWFSTQIITSHLMECLANR